MSILRSVLAVLLGYVAFAVLGGLLFKLAGRNPHAAQDTWFVIFAVVFGMLFAGIGGILAARLAPAKGTGHAAMVTALIAVGAAVSLAKSPASDATWSQWSAILLMAPSAWGAANWRRK